MIRYAKPRTSRRSAGAARRGAVADSGRRHRFLSRARQPAALRKRARHQRARRAARHLRNRVAYRHRRAHDLDRTHPPSAAAGLRRAEAGGARSRLGADPEHGVGRRQSLQRLAGRRRRAAADDPRCGGGAALARAARACLPLGEFILGNRQTALRPDEMVTAIRVPKASAAGASAFEKLGARRYLVISIAMAAARIVVGEDGSVSKAAIAVGSCSAVAQRLPALEAALRRLAARPEIAERCRGRRASTNSRRSTTCAAAPTIGARRRARSCCAR